jgi:prolyl oligopeptidase
MLLLRAWWLLFTFDVLNLFCRFESMYSIIKPCKIANATPDKDIIERVCKAVNYACVLYWKQAKCRQRSFVITYLLRNHGIAAELVWGAQKLPFRAHVWVEVEGHPVNERRDVQALYSVWGRT